MATYRIPNTERHAKLAKNICKSEDLYLTSEAFETALGDDVIELRGASEDIATFKDVFEMLA